MTQKGLAIKTFLNHPSPNFFGKYCNALMHQKWPPFAIHAGNLAIYFYLFKTKWGEQGLYYALFNLNQEIHIQQKETIILRLDFQTFA